MQTYIHTGMHTGIHTYGHADTLTGRHAYIHT